MESWCGRGAFDQTGKERGFSRGVRKWISTLLTFEPKENALNISKKNTENILSRCAEKQTLGFGSVVFLLGLESPGWGRGFELMEQQSAPL